MRKIISHCRPAVIIIPFIRPLNYTEFEYTCQIKMRKLGAPPLSSRLTGILHTSHEDYVRCSLISIFRSYGCDLNGLYVSAKCSGRCIPGVCPQCVRKKFRRLLRITVNFGLAFLIALSNPVVAFSLTVPGAVSFHHNLDGLVLC